jgi:acetyl-CoA carboxylase biotin carboxyl carrier protein
MNMKEVKELIQEVLQSDISEFELEHTGTRLRLKRGLGRDSAVVSPAYAQPPAAVDNFPQGVVPEAVPAQTKSAAEDRDNAVHVITSPIVGTFYRAPSPDAEPFVKLGDQVEEGSILCLVEAMKLMNEIPSDISGEVVAIYVENGLPVEFGQKLFGIRPRKQG